MKTYKITNITNLLGKRSFKQNSELEAEYVDGMVKKTLKIKPQETIYLTLNTLPLSIHRLRIKGLVTVSEISAKEMKVILTENERENIEVGEKPKKSTKKSAKEEENGESKIPIDDSVEKKTTRRTTKKTDSPDTEEKEDLKE